MSVAADGVTAETGQTPVLPLGQPELETVTIEIWRPGRRDRRPRDGAGARRGHQGRGGEGQGEGGRRDGGKPRGKPRTVNQFGSDKGRPGRGGGGGGRPDGGKPRGGKPGGGRNERPATIDPDSPFAKLAALKADMEKKPKA